MREKIQNALHKYQQMVQNIHLEKREKIILMVGIVVISCFTLLQLIVLPYLDARQKLIKSIERQQKNLIAITELQAQYRAQSIQQNSVLDRIKQRPTNFSLFSFLEKQSELAGIKDQIKYMKPSLIETRKGLNESLVEMKLQDITLKNLVTFLELVESEERVVFVRKITIQKSDTEQGSLDMTVQIATFMQADQ